MNDFELKNIKAIVGLGNPGSKYSKNRHTIGFRVIDALADKFNGSWQDRDDLQYCDVQILSSVLPEKQSVSNGIKIILVKSTTFMNASGRVLPFLLKKGIKPEEILVIHDELEKPFGKINLKFGGSAKGHNGLRSIIGMLGSDFWRLQFGIGRPEKKEDVSNYVLSNFTSEEELQLDSMIDQIINLII
ncbi:MAG: aminoacyl-tRNA hydrolase [bacterium]